MSDKESGKKLSKVVEDILNGMRADITEYVEDGFENIRLSYNQAILDHFIKGFKIEKLENGIYYISFIIPDVDVDENENIIISDSSEEGIAYGHYIGEAIQRFIKDNPDDDPKRILSDIQSGFTMMLMQAAEKIGLDPECIFK